MDWHACYLNRYEQQLGKSTGKVTFTQSATQPPIHILRFARYLTAKSYTTFGSLGVAEYADILGQVGEVYLPVQASTDEDIAEISYLFASALFFLIQNRMGLGWGMSIDITALASKRFRAQWGKTALYFTYALDDSSFGPVTCFGKEKEGIFRTAIFISDAERQFFKTHGAVQFQEAFETEDVDLFKLDRRSIF